MFHLPKTYDLIFSLGGACSCTEVLRKRKLQRASYPLDWVSGLPFPGRVDLVCRDFEGFLEQGLLENTGRQNNVDRVPCDIYRNTENGMLFHHDFPKSRPLSETFAPVREKYDRRIARLKNELAAAKRVLAVYLEPPNLEQKLGNPASLAAERDKLARRFPGKKCFDLLYVGCLPGVPYEARRELTFPESGVTYAAFDYRSRIPGIEPHVIEMEPLADYFRRFRLKMSLYERIVGFHNYRKAKRLRERQTQ